MGSTRIIQIVVFVLAGVIVIALVISAFHFVKAVHAAQQAEIRLRATQLRDLEAARVLRESRLPQLQEACGVVVQQPDGSESIAINMEQTGALSQAKPPSRLANASETRPTGSAHDSADTEDATGTA